MVNSVIPELAITASPTFLTVKGRGVVNFGQAEMPFTDVAPQDYFYKAVMWAVTNKVTTGMTLTTFGSDEDCTRAQIMTLLYRALAI